MAALLPPPGSARHQWFLQKRIAADVGQVTTEDLGLQTMEGVEVSGVRTTQNDPCRVKIGNDKPISIVTEVWTSTDLKTVVYSKRSDPRIERADVSPYRYRARGARRIVIRGAGGF